MIATNPHHISAPDPPRVWHEAIAMARLSRDAAARLESAPKAVLPPCSRPVILALQCMLAACEAAYGPGLASRSMDGAAMPSAIQFVRKAATRLRRAEIDGERLRIKDDVHLPLPGVVAMRHLVILWSAVGFGESCTPFSEFAPGLEWIDQLTRLNALTVAPLRPNTPGTPGPEGGAA